MRSASVSVAISQVAALVNDEDAYMAFALNNAQGELTPLERGLHAFGSTAGIREYANQAGVSAATVTLQRHAAEVFTRANKPAGAADKYKHLAEIHAAPPWCWQALVAGLVDGGWTIEQTRKRVQSMSKAAEAPDWIDLETLAERLGAGLRAIRRRGAYQISQ